MSTVLKRPKIKDVFTPRDRFVNTEMYIKRPELERSLIKAIDGHMHVMLFGESGNGKSWLYKHVLQQNEIKYISVNCGNAGRSGSIVKEIFNCCIPEGHLLKTTTEQKKEASASAAIFSGKLEATNIFEFHRDEPLLAAFKYLKSKEDRTILVIDNLEAICNSQAIIDELCNIILLLDDDRYAECNIKLLIVGTPNGVFDFFGKTPNLSSIANRIQEVAKVSGLDIDQVRYFVRQGFVNKLKIRMSEEQIEKFSKLIAYHTLGIAQRIQEFSSELAHAIEDNGWTYGERLITSAKDAWMKASLRSSYVVIESHLDNSSTNELRNKVLYAIGKISKNPFQASEIEDLIKRELQAISPEATTQIAGILAELSEPPRPILSRNDKNLLHYVLDPLHILCIRLILKKNSSTEKIEVARFKIN